MISREQQEEQNTVFTAAHNNYAKGLRTHAFFKIHDHSTSEDMVQQTFMKAWSYVVRGGKIDLMRAFLYHILKDLIVDEYRKHKPSSLDALLEKGFEPSIDSSERLMNMLDGGVGIRLIWHLPEPYQRVLRMRYLQFLSLKEMSLITGQSTNTVAVQAHRGLEKLKLLYHRR